MAYNLILYVLKKFNIMKRVILLSSISLVVSAITAFAVVKLTQSNISNSENIDSKTPVKLVNMSETSFPDLTYAAESAVKSVVHVKVTKKGNREEYSIFDFFFGYSPNMEPREQQGAGSGVIITSDGYIVTNNHVVDMADQIDVMLENNKSYKAKLVAGDPVTDIALLKIDAENLSYLTFGDSDSLRLGEWVLAIGNPYNLRSTVTAGIISAKARSVFPQEDQFKIESFIQTDAAVNPGNSGGALVNLKGELVGINTAIASRTGSYTGYSFAVPTSIVKKVIKDFMDYGQVKRALLGITMQDITDEIAKEKNIKEIRGVYIVDVVKGGSADLAGIKQSDLLISINGIDVNSSPSVQEQISKYSPKDYIEVEVLRDGKLKKFKVQLQSKKEDITKIADNSDGVSIIFGAKLKNPSKQLMSKLGIKGGVEVLSLDDGKFKNAGIKTGFVITYVNQIPVSSAYEINRIIKTSKRAVMVEGVYPNGELVYYAVGI